MAASVRSCCSRLQRNANLGRVCLCTRPLCAVTGPGGGGRPPPIWKDALRQNQSPLFVPIYISSHWEKFVGPLALRHFSSEQAATETDDDYHSIIKDTERAEGIYSVMGIRLLDYYSQVQILTSTKPENVSYCMKDTYQSCELARRCYSCHVSFVDGNVPLAEFVHELFREGMDDLHCTIHTPLTCLLKIGPADRHEFQAETRKLLDIVARSLYSEKEVFIRELISNASDALEKMRYLQVTGGETKDRDIPLEIHIGCDDSKKTFTIQDTGIGMTNDEMIENLGTIARSGTTAFLKELTEGSNDINKNIIGQFGVGFYATFMVGEKVEVYSQSYKPGTQALKWTSDGTGTYDIATAEGVQRGTKIVVHLKGDCYDYAKEEIVKEIVKKYSNFVGAPIFLNGKKANIVQALWLMNERDVTNEMHEEFYRFIGNTFDKPRYHFHYKTDAPLNIRALFYVPEYKPTLFDMSRETDVRVSLYSRKVMVVPKANHILPRWLRFVKGVVDSEDIPLNLSRELLQDSSLIRKLCSVLTNRILKFLLERTKKDKEAYLNFYEDYGLFIREGIVTTPDQNQREEIAKLLRFESSKCPAGERISLEDYTSRMKAGARDIYYLSVPSRELAETSPYFEALKKRDVEVLFLYEPYDELVLMNLGQFDRKFLKSVENEIQDDKEDTNAVDERDASSLKQNEANELMEWMKAQLTNKVNTIKVTKRLVSHPCIVTVVEMGSARHFLRTTLADKSQEERFRLLQPTLEINASHPLIKKLYGLKGSKPELSSLLLEQLYENAMITAGLIDDPRSMVQRINELLIQALDNH